MGADGSLSATHLMALRAAVTKKESNGVRACAQIGLLFSRDAFSCSFLPSAAWSLNPGERRRLLPLEGAAARCTTRLARRRGGAAVPGAPWHAENIPIRASYCRPLKRPVLGTAA